MRKSPTKETYTTIDFGLHGGGEAYGVATISRMLQNVGL